VSEDLQRYLEPLTFTTNGAAGTVWADYSASCKNGGSMTIGGDTCHLCGARQKDHNTFRRWTKKGACKVTEAHYYACGTRVYGEEDGRRSVEVGGKCIKVKGVV